MSKAEKVDQTLLWGLRGVGLLLMGVAIFLVLGSVIVFVATLVYGY